MFTWDPRDLNPEQVTAITKYESVFLRACPGSGKTRTLTYKIAYELERLRSSKQWVIAITYTHRAADEIHERVDNLGVDTSRLWVGTIHAFCLEWILKPYGIYHEALSRGFSVIDLHERDQLLERLCEPFSSPKVTPWDCEFYCNADGYVLCSQEPRKHDALHVILGKYFDSLLASRQIDFELILYYGHQLVTQYPGICTVLSQLFSHVLVDEYQDTRMIQYAIIASILKAGHGATKAFIVGDPNQAIYTSLGGQAIPVGEFRAMAGIELTELTLSKNYRSSQRIIGYFSNYQSGASPIEAFSEHKGYASHISFNTTVPKHALEAEIERLLSYSIKTVGIAPREICVLAPQWTQLASMTRRLVASMPEYEFDGPGMVPFARDPDNFWYKLAKIALTRASPSLYVRRLRWAGDVLAHMDLAGMNVSALTRSVVLRECNMIEISESDGLHYLEQFFAAFFARLGTEIGASGALQDHHTAFFQSSQIRIDRMKKDGAALIGDISAFRKVFQSRTGITISTIHGIKGAEFDTVIAYALLENMVPHFRDPAGQESARKLLYVISSRARKHLHLLSERGRYYGKREEYQPTQMLANCQFTYDVI